MSIHYGITPAGFVAKPLATVKTEIEAKLKAGPLGESAGTEPDGSIPVQSIAGQIVAIIVDPIAALWDLIQAVVASTDPAQATDALQDQVNSLTGAIRDPSSYSTVVETCTGVPTTVIPVGRVAKVATSGTPFASTIPAAIVVVPSYVNGQTQVAGDRRTVGGSVYQCTTPGVNTNTLDGAQRGTGIADGPVRWTWLGLGTGAVDVPFRAQQTGLLGATAGTLTTIGTPVYGWNGAYNVLDAVPGALRETNTAFRVRREAELHSSGLSAADAIRRRVLAVGEGTAAPVTSCTVFVNDSDVTDADNLPPHSVMVLADYAGADNPALDQLIAQAIWGSVGGGIATSFGNAVGAGYKFANIAVTDSQGNIQLVNWARPVPKLINIIVDVTYDNTPGVFPASEGSGAAAPAPAIKGALTTFGETYLAGRAVRATALSASVFDGPISPTPGAQPVPGVLDVTKLWIAIDPAIPVAGTTLAISDIQRAVFDSGHIVVNLTGAAP